jgi:hypothetical protein
MSGRADEPRHWTRFEGLGSSFDFLIHIFTCGYKVIYTTVLRLPAQY